MCPFLYDNILLFCLVSQGGPGQESGPRVLPEGFLLILTLLPTAPLLLMLLL